MGRPMPSRKRPLFNGYRKEPRRCKRKCLTSLKTLLTRYGTDTLKANCHSCVNGGTKHLTETKSFLFETLSLWSDTQSSAKKVLEHLEPRRLNDDIFLDDSVNGKFLDFHRDITEECGAEDKQHSWAVIEKQGEIVMYGPYYPNYSSGEHSEDIVVRQTQTFLESKDVSEDWKVYVFTMNSPCLARNTGPCMLTLVHKAQEWWSLFGVKTHIGYVKSWGFKGSKETLFRDITFSQVECIGHTEDYESYVQTAEKSFGVKYLCENQFSAVKRLLSPEGFPLVNTGQDWRGYFKSMHGVFESKPEDERKTLSQELDTTVEAAQTLLSVKSGSIEEHLEKGRAFAADCTFGSQVPDDIRDQMRLSFQQCWKEMVRDKHAEFIRDKLTDVFNRCTVQLFIKDVARFTGGYLQIGRIQF